MNGESGYLEPIEENQLKPILSLVKENKRLLRIHLAPTRSLRIFTG
jgi:hypothetical protein